MSVPPTASTLVKWAEEAGFDRAGVASLEPSEHADAYRRWLEQGRHAEMAYLERRSEERLDPRKLFEGARSVLCVAQQYCGSDDHEPTGALAHVARYARGRDYHDTIKVRLQRLLERIRAAHPESSARVYVDTGPVLERELAARAGVGSFGKNTNLLHPEAGSWFFLAEIFLDLDFDLGFDDGPTPIADLCGSCTRCLEACPTGALPAPYELDATRCISYWTIEHRGWLPEEMRSQLEGWLFGCDVCQEVCPVNEGISIQPNSDFALDAERGQLSLERLLELPRDEYVELFRGSPMKRAKLEGLQRNAAVVLGNSADPRQISVLESALEHVEPTVRGHAAWALGAIGGAVAEGALRSALGGETDDRVRSEIEEAIGVC